MMELISGWNGFSVISMRICKGLVPRSEIVKAWVVVVNMGDWPWTCLFLLPVKMRVMTGNRTVNMGDWPWTCLFLLPVKMRVMTGNRNIMRIISDLA